LTKCIKKSTVNHTFMTVEKTSVQLHLATNPTRREFNTKATVIAGSVVASVAGIMALNDLLSETQGQQEGKSEKIEEEHLMLKEQCSTLCTRLAQYSINFQKISDDLIQIPFTKEKVFTVQLFYGSPVHIIITAPLGVPEIGGQQRTSNSAEEAAQSLQELFLRLENSSQLNGENYRYEMRDLT
jgi:hypothetical protein